MAHNLNKRIKKVSMEKSNTFQYTSFHCLFWQENTRKELNKQSIVVMVHKKSISFPIYRVWQLVYGLPF